MAYQQLDQGKAFLNASSLRGREIDTLHIEALLLLGAPSPLLIYGMAGIGKTALLDHLRRWWETSGMVGDSIHIYLGANEPFNKNNMLSRLEDHFIRCCCSTDDSKPSLFDHLGSHKCLIIFDDLDKAALGRQKGQFLNLTTKLAKSGALVIMSSRKRETWLSKAKAYQLHGVQTRLAALSTIDGIFNVDGANKKTRMQRLADKTEEEKDSLEGVVEVLGGSPQVIELLARSDLYSSMAPKEIYLSLLGIPTDKKVDPASKGRSPSGSDVEEQPRSITSFTEIYEKLSPICTGEGFLPLLLAPFINTIPYQDLPKILSIWSARVRHVLGDDASRGLVHAARGFYELHRHAFKLPENARDCVEALLEVSQNLAPREVPPSSEPVPLLREAHEPSKQLEALDYLLNTMCDRVATELTSVGLLGELSPVPEALKERGLMRLNPLINILSKNILVYKEDLFSVRTTVNEAFVLYYCSRGEKWPWSGFHNLWNQWAEAGTEIDFEFNNFASACIIGLVKIDLDTVNLMALLRIAAVLNRGEGTKSHYRKFVHFQVCTAALARSLAAMMKLQDEGVARQTEMFMFVVAAIWFSCELRRYHELDSKPDEEMSHRALVGKLATLASANVPSGIREALEVDEKSPEESFHKLALMAADSDASFRDMMHVHMTSNVFRFANPFDMKFYLKPGTTTSALSELDLVTMLSYSAEVGQYTSMVGSLREKIKQQEWAATDELVNQMLSLEINSEVSSCKSRIRTIQIQKKIAGQQRDDGRMNTLTEELSRLEQAMVEQNQKRSRQPWLER